MMFQILIGGCCFTLKKASLQGFEHLRGFGIFVATKTHGFIKNQLKMSKVVRRNAKKIVDKINHSSKLRTDIPAQMAVGE
jgi:hypothetical protein